MSNMDIKHLIIILTALLAYVMTITKYRPTIVIRFDEQDIFNEQFDISTGKAEDVRYVNASNTKLSFNASF